MKFASLLSFTLSCGFAFGQGGSLTPPPGSPAPNMKSLDQVEARTPLVEGAPGVGITPGSGNITISQSGSYYLTGNLTVTGGNAIVITSDFVTLNLNGFTISSTAEPASGNGIFILGSSVTVTGGSITGSYNIQEESGAGFATGIKSDEDGPLTIHNLNISNCSEDGISIGASDIKFNSVSSCFVQNVGNFGIIAASVDRCQVLNTGSDGIVCDTASYCRVHTNGTRGITGQMVSHCKSYSANFAGIEARNVSNSMGTSYSGTGIDGQVISHSIGKSLEGTSILASRLVTFSHGNFGGNIMNGHFSINAPMAVGCTGGAHLITNEFLMP